jgi:hypothetical protein
MIASYKNANKPNKPRVLQSCKGTGDRVHRPAVKKVAVASGWAQQINKKIHQQLKMSLPQSQ